MSIPKSSPTTTRTTSTYVHVKTARGAVRQDSGSERGTAARFAGPAGRGAEANARHGSTDYSMPVVPNPRPRDQKPDVLTIYTIQQFFQDLGKLSCTN